MTCRHCKRDIPDNALFCPWCGKEQAKPRKRTKSEITVPKATLTASGMWYIRLRLNGESIPIYADTEAQCKAEAIAVKSGIADKAKASKHSPTLGECIDRYIEDRAGVLSPATCRGYRQVRLHRFQSVMDDPVEALTNWQSVISREASLCSPKTLKNAWGLIRSVLAENNIQINPVKLPQVIKSERPWLDYEQIGVFLNAAYGKPGELAALLALHSLRRSEICAVTPSDVDLKAGTISIAGSAVFDEDCHLVFKDTNKTVASRRVIPIMIPRLNELLTAIPPEQPRLVQEYPNSVWRQINRICRKSGLPEVGIHGLRHSFASLAYHLGMSEQETMELGGWSDSQTIHRIYLHLAKADRLNAANKMSEFYAGLQQTC